jgi:hypothetical protein
MKNIILQSTACTIFLLKQLNSTTTVREALNVYNCAIFQKKKKRRSYLNSQESISAARMNGPMMNTVSQTAPRDRIDKHHLILQPLEHAIDLHVRSTNPKTM